MDNDKDEKKHDKNKEIELRVGENKHSNHQQYEGNVKLDGNAPQRTDFE
jgi:hypothetical protein